VERRSTAAGFPYLLNTQCFTLPCLSHTFLHRKLFVSLRLSYLTYTESFPLPYLPHTLHTQRPFPCTTGTSPISYVQTHLSLCLPVQHSTYARKFSRTKEQKSKSWSLSWCLCMHMFDVRVSLLDKQFANLVPRPQPPKRRGKKTPHHITITCSHRAFAEITAVKKTEKHTCIWL
jgi:hypothetical protein